MTTLLVVEGCECESSVSSRLELECPGWKILAAETESEGLRHLHVNHPDVLISDFGGRPPHETTLFKTVREHFPRMPILVIADSCSESTLEALMLGASTFIPRCEVSRDLKTTIERILALSGAKRWYGRILDCLKETDFRFEVKNDLTLLPMLIAQLQDAAEQFGFCEERDRVRMGVALEEALVNAIVHGNLEVGSGLRTTDYEAYEELVQVRRKEAPYASRVVDVAAKFTHAHAEFTIGDEGLGFDPSSIPDPANPANIDRIRGRGLLLIRTFMDEVEFSDAGNQITLRKLRGRKASTAA